MNKRKEEATKLRKNGYSYGMITEKLQISKSTLSCWFKDIPFVPNEKVIERIKKGPFKSGRIKHNLRVESTSKIKALAREELGKISDRDLWMLGIGLYIGEGSKAYEIIRVVNSDPEVIKLAMKWFKNSCGLNNGNITLAVHLYPDNNVKKSLDFWSKTTGIALKQFRKTQIDKRIGKSWKKQRKLPYGTAHITINSNGNSEFGVKLHRRIMGWIEGSLGQI
ncbi:MAG: hypothetical protein COU40_00635 [Candidatus Moranbacteria bacterium CG10_big_fil_rev_8_21_14_0_10_35_21]|nr:MAG: hypothetical protein COU40_00635 [Candidatus Moranbacteria bacterium CG10_big_fil_rev_8_21_14_0_10_35_21]PJA88494.1 MAG: hypothetical protein CO139_02815 [Candidatus Moranbacteria bacterium CG_4_9_14_3_um_filter_36_9]